MQNRHVPDGVLGLEFGSTSIKLIELSTTDAGYRLESMAVAPLPEDAIVEGTIVDEGAVLHAVRQAIAAAGTQARKATILFHGPGFDIRRRNIPRMNRGELDAGIGTLIEETLPWEMADRLFDYRIGMTDDSDKMELTAISFPRYEVETMVRLCGSAGVEAKYLVSESSCLGMTGRNLAAATADNQQQKQPVEMLMRLGGNTSHYVICKDERLLDYRWGGCAGHLLTEAIRNAHSFGFEEAERIKTENFSGIDPAALDTFYEQLIAHIRHDIDIFHHRHPDYHVQRLHMSGGCMLLPGLMTLLQINLDVNVVAANPFEPVEIPADRFDRNELMRIAPMMATVFGAVFVHDIDLTKRSLSPQ